MHSQVVELGILQDWSLLTEMVKAEASAAQLARSEATTRHGAATSAGCSLTMLIMPWKIFPSLATSGNIGEEQH